MAFSLTWLCLLPLSAAVSDMVLLAAGLGVLCALTSLFASLAYVRRQYLLDRIVKDEVGVTLWTRHIPLTLAIPGRCETPPQYVDLSLTPVLVLWVVPTPSWSRAFVVHLGSAPPTALVGSSSSGNLAIHHGSWYSFPPGSLSPCGSEFSVSLTRDGWNRRSLQGSPCF